MAEQANSNRRNLQSRHRLSTAGLLLAMLAICCSQPSSLPPGPESAAENLKLYDSFADRSEREALIASWERAMRPGNHVKTKLIGVKPLLLLTESERRVWRSQLKSEEEIRVLEAVTDRAIQMQSASVPKALSLTLNIRKVYANMTQQSASLYLEGEEAERKQAWINASTSAAVLEPMLKALRFARNEWAGEQGKGSFLGYIGKHQGYEPATVERLQREAQQALETTASTAVDPWNVEASDPELMQRLRKVLDEERLLDRGRALFVLLNLPENPPGLTIDSSAKGDFSRYATFEMNPPKDVRMMLLPEAGIAAHWRTLHEFGHAAQALLAPSTGPVILRRIICPAVAEGCAKVAERLVFAPEWLKQNGVPAVDIDALKLWERASERARMRSILADMEFETVYYEDPEADLKHEFARIQRQIAGVNQSETEPVWTLQRQLAFKPQERAQYLLARCAQAAIYRRLRALPGGLLGDEAARVLRKDVFEFAAGRRFEEWFQKAAGAEPTCGAWIEDVAGVKPAAS